MSQNKRYAYVTIDDLYSMGDDAKDQTLLAIKAPADTLLEVPRREDRKVKRSYYWSRFFECNERSHITYPFLFLD